jgi:(2Fe-2S) ferredoxin
MPPFEKHIFICINERKPDDARGCCHSRDSKELLDYMKVRVHELGLKGKVRVNKAGCLDACAQGPSMVVYPDNIWYSPKTKKDIEEIITQHIQCNLPVNHLTIRFKQKA